jgi:hypothetical protein
MLATVSELEDAPIFTELQNHTTCAIKWRFRKEGDGQLRTVEPNLTMNLAVRVKKLKSLIEGVFVFASASCDTNPSTASNPQHVMSASCNIADRCRSVMPYHLFSLRELQRDTGINQSGADIVFLLRICAECALSIGIDDPDQEKISNDLRRNPRRPDCSDCVEIGNMPLSIQAVEHVPPHFPELVRRGRRASAFRFGLWLREP